MMACTLNLEHTDSQPVKIQDFVNASTYWLIPDQKEPPANKIDRLLSERVCTANRPNHFLPKEEQMIAVRHPETNIWHRGKVKTIFLAEHNYRYLVFLVDYGKDIKVAQNSVRELPADEIFQKEHHATQFKLYGVVPRRTQVAMASDFSLESVIGKEWDPKTYTFITKQLEDATAIYISPMKNIDLCDGNIIQGDLHFVVGGRCVSIIKLLCEEKHAVFDELLFKERSGILQGAGSKPQTACKQMKSGNLPAACSDDLIATTPSISHGRGRQSIANTSLNTPAKASCVSPIKEPVFIPGGIDMNVLTQKARRMSQSPIKISHGTNNPNANRRQTAPASTSNTSPLATHNNITTQQNSSFSPSSSVKSVRDVTEERAMQYDSRSASKVSSSTSPRSNGTESSRVLNVSPKTTSDLPEQLQNVVVNPVSPDSPQQCVTARGRRFQTLLKQLATTAEKGNANETLEEASFNSSLDSVNISGNGSSPSGLFSQIKTAFDRSKTESNDSNCGFTPVNSPRCLNDESPSNTPSGNLVQNKFLSHSDADTPSPYRHRQNVGKLADILLAVRVLVRGRDVNGTTHKAEEIQTVESAKLHPLILKGLNKAHMTSLTRIQRVVWPAVVRGENVIMVHPPRSGKSLAYIAPLFSSLLYNEQYLQLPAGKGPLAVILCASAHSCECVGKEINRLLQGYTNIRVMLAFAGQDQQHHLVHLTNGCDVLVTTPRCLLRLLGLSSVTDLTRICHLVLDEADVLVDKFSFEIRSILDKCSRSKQHRERKGISNNVQIVVATQKWCPIVRDLLEPLAPYPLICIGSYLEAAIYARLQPSLMILNAMEKREKLTEILGEHQYFWKIVIVCQTADDVEEVITFLKPLYPTILKADERMAHNEFLEVLPGWKALDIYGMYPILICSDVVLPELSIEDATCLIHYSLPDKKTLFGIRFSCLMKNYPNWYDEKAECTTCKVFIFIGDENRSQFPGVLTFMKRLGATILPQLELTAKEVLMEKEHTKETVPLCKTLVAFGECWYKDVCSLRHAILERDKPINIPEMGHVKLKFLFAVTASHFTARLLEHTDSHGVTHSSRNNYLKIMTQMKSHFAHEENRVLHGYPKLGDICAYETNGVFYRSEVTEIKSYDTANKPENVRVQFIDNGRGLQCHIGKLLGLPKFIQEIPPLAVNVIMCKLLPPDLDYAWCEASTQQMTWWLREAEEVEEDGPFIMGNIKLSLGNTLWLDPVQGRQCVPDDDSKTGLILKDFRQIMLRENLAISNPNHLTKLYDICKESGITIPDYSLNSATTKSPPKPSKQLPKPQWAFLPDEDLIEVFFTSANNPGEFFMCLCKFVSNLKRLSNEIQKFVANYKPLEENHIIQAGVHCLGRFPDDGMWYRAEVLRVTDEGQVELFFVDHGDSAVVDAAGDIIPIQPKHISSLPFQAIECSLAGIEPFDGEIWTEQATDELYELSVNLKTDCRKPMYINHCRKEKAICTSGHKYNILLACMDDDEKIGIVVNEVLLKNGLARLSESDSKCMESQSLNQMKTSLIENEEIPEENDSGMWDDDRESDPEPVCKQPDISSDMGSHCDKESEDTDNTSNLGAVVPLKNKNSWLADEVYTGFGDFDFEFGNEEDIHPAEVFIRNFLKLGPKEDASPIERTSNQRLPGTEHLSDVRQSTVDRTDPCLRALSQNVVSTATANVMVESPSDSKTPNVIWHQDQLYVTMSVEIANIEDASYDLRVDKTIIAFKTVVLDETYSFNLQLYGAVFSDLSEHASTGRTIRIKLTKIVPGIWPRVQKIKKSFWWLRYNIDHADNDVEDFVRVNPFGQRRAAQSKKDVCLDLQVIESDDSDMDEDERDFERRDPFNPLL